MNTYPIVYLVGGAVRDKLLQRPIIERDWVVVGGTLDWMLRAGYIPVGKDFPVFLHPKTKEEYALARIERKSGKGYTGFICDSAPSVTLEEDLQRRDLTINAMAMSESGEIIDPYNGRDDLKNRILRHVSAAFTEDPLRVLRVARFAARYAPLGFGVAADTLDLMRQVVKSNELSALTSERVWKELRRALVEACPAQFFIILRESGALQAIFPDLTPDLDFLKIFQVAVTLSEDPVVRLAALLYNLKMDSIEKIANQYKLPKDYHQLLILVSRFSNLCQQAKALNVENLLKLLINLDVLRRPKRFEQFLLVCTAANAACPVNYLKDAVQIIRNINVAECIMQGLPGSIVAQKLHKMRLEALGQILFS